MGRISNTIRWICKAIWRVSALVSLWLGRKLVSTCYFAYLLTVMVIDAGWAGAVVVYHLTLGDGVDSAREELQDFSTRQKGRFRPLAKHGWRATSKFGE